MDLRRTLDELLEHDEKARLAERELLASESSGPLVEAVSEALQAALVEGAQERLERLAALLGAIPEDGAVRLLLDILGRAGPEARAAAGEALVELAASHLDLVRGGIEAALGDGRAEKLPELGYVVAELEGPGAVELLVAMLGHDEASVVAAALEVAAELAFDGAVVAALERLRGDERTVRFDDSAEGAVELSVGELAEELLEAVSELRGSGART